MFKESLAFGDVLLSPQYSDITSRREVSLESALGNLKFTIPIISSPMDTISEVKMAQTLGDYGGLSILHRYNSIEEQVSLAIDCAGTMVGAAVGASGDYLERAAALKPHVDVICIDVAHGHHLLMRDAIKESAGDPFVPQEYKRDTVFQLCNQFWIAVRLLGLVR